MQQPIIIITVIAILALSVSVAASPNINQTEVNNSVTTLTIPTPTPTYSSSSGSGSSGGGGSSVGTSENFSNVVEYEKADFNLKKNTSISNRFRSKNLSVYELSVNGQTNEDGITFKVELLKNISKTVTMKPDGQVYKYLNIYSGTKRLNSAKIRFRIENTFITVNSKIELMRWVNGIWVSLVTNQINKDDTYTYYEAETPGFSSFAIVDKSQQQQAAQLPEQTPVQPPKQLIPTVTKTPIIVQLPFIPTILVNQSNQSNQSILTKTSNFLATVPLLVWYVLALLVIIVTVPIIILRKKLSQGLLKNFVARVRVKEKFKLKLPDISFPKINRTKLKKYKLNIDNIKEQE